MKVVDVSAEILQCEDVEFLSGYPTNTMIEAASRILPIRRREI